MMTEDHEGQWLVNKSGGLLVSPVRRVGLWLHKGTRALRERALLTLPVVCPPFRVRRSVGSMTTASSGGGGRAVRYRPPQRQWSPRYIWKEAAHSKSTFDLFDSVRGPSILEALVSKSRRSRFSNSLSTQRVVFKRLREKENPNIPNNLARNVVHSWWETNKQQKWAAARSKECRCAQRSNESGFLFPVQGGIDMMADRLTQVHCSTVSRSPRQKEGARYASFVPW
jgi:hypothetical protein